MSKPSDLVQGTLDMLILKILGLEPLNGWAVSKRLKQMSSDVLAVSDGSLYPALPGWNIRGWITAHWKPVEATVAPSLFPDEAQAQAARKRGGRLEPSFGCNLWNSQAQRGLR